MQNVFPRDTNVLLNLIQESIFEEMPVTPYLLNYCIWPILVNGS